MSRTNALSGIGVVLILILVTVVVGFGVYIEMNQNSVQRPSLPFGVDSTCISPSSSPVMNGSTTYTVVQACYINRLVLDPQGCYGFSSGAGLCVKGAPQGSIADWYSNGTIIVTYPNGNVVRCDIAHGGSDQPCIVGIP